MFSVHCVHCDEKSVHSEHCEAHCLHCTVFSVYSTLCSVQCSKLTGQCVVSEVQGKRALYKVHCPQYSFGVDYTKHRDTVNHLIDTSKHFLPHLFLGSVAENFGENLFYQFLVKIKF